MLISIGKTGFMTPIMIKKLWKLVGFVLVFKGIRNIEKYVVLEVKMSKKVAKNGGEIVHFDSRGPWNDNLIKSRYKLERIYYNFVKNSRGVAIYISKTLYETKWT